MERPFLTEHELERFNKAMPNVDVLNSAKESRSYELQVRDAIGDDDLVLIFGADDASVDGPGFAVFVDPNISTEWLLQQANNLADVLSAHIKVTCDAAA